MSFLFVGLFLEEPCALPAASLPPAPSPSSPTGPWACAGQRKNVSIRGSLSFPFLCESHPCNPAAPPLNELEAKERKSPIGYGQTVTCPDCCPLPETSERLTALLRADVHSRGFSHNWPQSQLQLMAPSSRLGIMPCSGSLKSCRMFAIRNKVTAHQKLYIYICMYKDFTYIYIYMN